MAAIPHEIVESLRRTSRLADSDYGGHNLVDVSDITDPAKVFKIKSRLNNAEDVSFLPGDHLVVADKTNHVVRVFDEHGRYTKTVTSGCKPYGLDTNRSGMVIFVDHGDSRGKMIKVLNWESGHMFSQWGDEMSWNPRGLCMNNKGQIVVTNVDKLKHEVGVYTIDGKLVTKFGSLGSGAREFTNPNYVHVDVYDRILVSDQGNNTIKLFDDRSGNKLLGEIGRSKGTPEGNLSQPRGVTSDSKGNIFVADTGNNRVCLYSAEGDYIRTLLNKDDFLHYPYGIAFNRQTGRLAVTQHNKKSSGASFRKINVYSLLK